MSEGQVVAVCVSTEKGTQKQAVDTVELVRGHGLKGDAHAGDWHRQVSLLEDEQIDTMRNKGLDLFPGAFGENIVTRGFSLGSFEIGTRFRVGPEAVLQVTQRGKECHTRCAIYYKTGDCIMPTMGIFCRVRRGGTVSTGDVAATDPDLDRLRWAVLTLSDKGTAGEREDTSGQVVCELVEQHLGGKPVAKNILPDDSGSIQKKLIELCDEQICDLVITTGGTGLSPRDVTPEASRAVIDREIPGMAEAMRAAGLAHTPHAMLSRAVCGLRGPTIIINLSGSPKAVREQLQVLFPVLPHAVETACGLSQDCASRST